MGGNSSGQLGDGTTNDVSNTAEEIVTNNVVAVVAGESDSLFIKSGGSLWGMGFNVDGELGLGTNVDVQTPEEIVSNGVVAVATGYSHSLFVKSDGSLWGMGDNSYGQLGDDSFNSTNKPEEIVSNNVLAVAAGGAYSLFLKSDGSLWGMGDNFNSFIGSGTTNVFINTPEEIVSNGVVAVACGTIVSWAGWASDSLFVKSDGSLWGMGENNSGQLGDGTFNFTNQPEEIVSKNVVAIAAGASHSLFLKSDGSLWGMGDNSDGELGNGSGGSSVPEKVAGGSWLRGTCFAGGTYRVLSSTNLDLPVSQWTPVWTNTIVHRGPNNFSAPLPADMLSHDPQRFYILQSP